MISQHTLSTVTLYGPVDLKHNERKQLCHWWRPVKQLNQSQETRTCVNETQLFTSSTVIFYSFLIRPLERKMILLGRFDGVSLQIKYKEYEWDMFHIMSSYRDPLIFDCRWDRFETLKRSLLKLEWQKLLPDFRLFFQDAHLRKFQFALMSIEIDFICDQKVKIF